MLKSSKSKFIVCMVSSLLGLWLLMPTVWSLYHPDDSEKIPKYLPNSAMKLGLDLQGGIHMVLGVDLDKVVTNQLASYGRSLEKAAQSQNLGSVKTQVLPQSFELEVTPANPADKQKISDYIGTNFTVLEFVGDSGNTLVTRMSKRQEEEIRNRAIDQSIETLRNRIDEFGVAEPILSRKGDSQILVQFPGAKEPERLKSLIGQTAQLNFQIVHECRDGACLAKQQADLEAKIKAAEAKGSYTRDTFKRFSEYRARLNEDLKAELPADTTLAFERVADINVNNQTKNVPYLLSTKNVLSGEYIEEAFVDMNQQKGGIGAPQPVVAFHLNAVGAPLLANLTSEFRGYFMAIVLDGVIRSAPVIQNPITGGQGIVTLGRGSLEDMNKEARDLSIVLRAGALPANIEVQEERVIGASIGKDAIEAGKSAIVVTAVLVFLFFWIYYGVSGLIANLVSTVNVIWVFALLGSLGATLTLPGIAGVVLTLGMAADAIIIIFERMREELRAGRSTKQVIDIGFDRAFSTILDSNVTTAIGAFVLLQYGTGSIRGFALTLLVGILVNVIVATFFMKTLFLFFFENRGPKGFSIGIGKPKNEAAPALR